MADLDLQSLGMRLGEAITPTPRDAPQVRYGTIDAVNADGTLDVAIDGTTLRGMCATTGCVGAAEGMRCVVLRQGPLATVVGLIASTNLVDVRAPVGGLSAQWLSVNNGTATIASDGYARVGHLDVGDAITYGGSKQYKEVLDSTGKSLANNTWTSLGSVSLAAGVWVVVFTAQFTANATGRRGINLASTAGSSSTNAQAAMQVPAASGAQTVVSRANILNVTSTTTYHINAYQNSGSALTTYSDIRAARIA